MHDLLEEIKVPNYTLQNDVYVYLRNNILKGKLKPGERINETVISKKLSISKSPIREAMRKLEADGLITIKPRIGCFVIKLDAETAREIYEARQAIEGFAVRLLANKSNEELVEDLLEILKEYKETVENEDHVGRSEVDTKFHLRIVTAAGNSKLVKLFMTFRDQSLLLKNIASYLPGRQNQSLIEHQEIVKAIQNKDYSLAQEAIINHIEGLKKKVVEWFLQVESNQFGI
ncbi:GntR family transcriptional regulator [Neomoorella mulderi]|uniref:HTH-type transcriptional regulator LutR n=1 Tax=Moorella mulderi DSM 14980 TaxID=1122241 RepID=A0A151ASR7_9FIRM|nr:GntR family transcriptional regulator [Moorella mulderi]KYH30689.1 HTH-type transcriptional regulator LutR [Moorella mulderi DSM 14980]